MKKYRWLVCAGLLVLGISFSRFFLLNKAQNATAAIGQQVNAPGSPLSAFSRIPAFAGATYREFGALHPQVDLQKLPYQPNEQMNDRNIRRFDFIDDEDAFSNLTISPDGRHLAMDVQANNTTPSKLVVIDLQSNVAKKISIPGKNTNFGFFDWDPRDPEYLLLSVNTHIDDNNNTSREWRMRFDGTTQTPLSLAKEDFNAQITPDGDWWIVHTDPPPENGPQTFLQARNKPQQRKAVDWPWYAYILSPNSRYIARVENGADPFKVYDRITGKTVTLLASKEMMFTYDNEYLYFYNNFGPSACWFPDSTGVLLPITMQLPGGDRAKWVLGKDYEHQLWALTLEGERYRLFHNLRIIANSTNGRFWLVYHYQNKKYYLINIPQKTK